MFAAPAYAKIRCFENIYALADKIHVVKTVYGY